MTRPTYLNSERVDHLARMITELAAEVWVLRDRLTIVEHLLEQNGSLNRQMLNTFVPEGAFAEELAATRKELIDRVLGAPFGRGSGTLEPRQ